MSIRDFEPLPYYRWYWRDFRSSRAVQKLHYVARGLYRELLDECWARGFMPNDLAKLAELCDCPVPIMEKHWPSLEQFFVDDGDGLLLNERLENERSESDKLRVKKVLAGKRSGETRRSKGTQSNTDEQNRTDVQGTRTETNTLLSSSSSSSKQSKSSSNENSSSNDVLPFVAPSAPATLTGRAPGARGGGMTPIADLATNWDSVRRAALGEKQ